MITRASNGGRLIEIFFVSYDCFEGETCMKRMTLRIKAWSTKQAPGCGHDWLRGSGPLLPCALAPFDERRIERGIEAAAHHRWDSLNGQGGGGHG